MNLRLRVHPSALQEAEAATEWYAKQSTQAAERFLDELRSAIERVLRSPCQFPQLVFGTRRLVMRRFPYVVVFREIQSTVEIVAIAHGRRRPDYWRERVG